MRAAVLHRLHAPFVIEDVTLAEPAAGEVMVRMAASGVCRSDHHLVTGVTPHPMPVVCGHEGSGVVDTVGAGVTRVAPGDHVVLSWAPSCGSCFYCTHGVPAQCDTFLEPVWNGTMIDGTTRLALASVGAAPVPVYHYAALASFAEAVVVPESCCVRIPSDVPLEAAALVGCCVATGVGAVLNRGRVQQDETVAVFGCGGVGISIIQGALLSGAGRVIAVDVDAARRELAMRFGATDVLDASASDPVETIRAMTDGRGADVTFEAIGRPDVMAQALEAARRGGRVVLVGLGGAGEYLELGADTFTRSDKLLMGAYYGGCDPARDMPKLLDLYRAGRLKLDEMIGRRRPLDEINEAFADLEAGEILRTLIVF